MRTRLLLFLLMLIPASLLAQNYATITGSNFQDASHNLVASATLCFTPASSNGSRIGSNIASSGQQVTTSVCVPVVNGAITPISTATFQIANVALTNPSNICYNVTLTDSSDGSSLLGPGYNCVQPSSATTSSSWCAVASGVLTCDLDQYIPNEPAQTPSINAQFTGSTCTSTDPGTAPSLSFTGTAPNFGVACSIPEGQTGLQGTAATIQAGSVIYTTPGTTPSVINSGTSNAAIFNFSLPKNVAPTLSFGSLSIGTADASLPCSTDGSSCELNLTLPVGVNYRGQWAQNTSYVSGDAFMAAGVIYITNIAFTSGTSFDSSSSDISSYSAFVNSYPGVSSDGSSGLKLSQLTPGDGGTITRGRSLATPMAIAPSSLVNLGDSIAACEYVNKFDCYVYRIAGAVGVLSSNVSQRAVGFSWIEDIENFQLLANPLPAPAPSGQTLYLTDGGANNIIYNGSATNSGKDLFSTDLLGYLSMLGTTSAYKVAGSNAASVTGTCANDTTYTAITGEACTANASSFTLTETTYGAPIYIWYRSISSDAGTWSYSVDGGASVAEVTAPLDGNYSTVNGSTYGVSGIRIPVSAGSHTVTFTQTADGTMSILGIGTTPNASINDLTTTTYAAQPSILYMNITGKVNQVDETLIEAYRAIIKSTITALQADGMNITLAPVERTLQANSADMANSVHPSGPGHAEMYEAAIPLLPVALAQPYTSLTQLAVTGSISAGSAVYTWPSSTCGMDDTWPSGSMIIINETYTTGVTMPTMTAGCKFTLMLNGTAGTSIPLTATTSTPTNLPVTLTALKSQCLYTDGTIWRGCGGSNEVGAVATAASHVLGSSSTVSACTDTLTGYQAGLILFTCSTGAAVTLPSSVSGMYNECLYDGASSSAVTLTLPSGSSGPIIIGPGQTVCYTPDSTGPWHVDGNYSTTAQYTLGGVTAASACSYTLPATAGGLYTLSCSTGAAITFPSSTSVSRHICLLNTASVPATLTLPTGSTGTSPIAPNQSVCFTPATTGPWYAVGDYSQTIEGTTASIGGTALTAGSCSSGTATATGALTSSTSTQTVLVTAAPGTDPGGNFILRGSVTASNTVTVNVCAIAAGTPTATTYNVRVLN